MDSAEQFNQVSADQEREIICKKYSHAGEMSIEIQRVTRAGLDMSDSSSLGFMFLLGSRTGRRIFD